MNDIDFYILSQKPAALMNSLIHSNNVSIDCLAFSV